MPLLATTLVPRTLVAERRCRFPYLRKILTLFPSCVIDLRLTVVTSHLLGQIGAVATNRTPPASLVWVILQRHGLWYHGCLWDIILSTPRGVCSAHVYHTQEPV